MKPEPKCLQVFPSLRKPPSLTKHKVTFLVQGIEKLNMKIGAESTILKMNEEDFNYLVVENIKHYQRTSWFKLEMMQYCCF